MGSYILGVVLFALGIAVTIALHELGHLLAARSFGMRVRRYFIGFGPTVWSTTKGHTEYGVAALPFGGFCDIAGMTAQDPVTAEEAPHAMVNKPWWQRVIVLSGGVLMNLFLGFIILYFVAVSAGIPNPYADRTPTVGEVACVSDQIDEETLADCSGSGPAGEAGVQVGDKLVSVDGHQLEHFTDLRDYVMLRPGEIVELTVDRGGQELTLPINVEPVKRLNAQGEMVDAGAIGLVNAPVKDPIRQFGPLEAVPASLTFSAQTIEATFHALLEFPAKIPGVVAAVFGAERDVEDPMSVVGASMAGGELVERSLWSVFWMLLANLNFFLAMFNLVPLPPLDGGHIAVVLYEKVRDFFRGLRRLPPGPPANYEKLMPLTFVMAATLLTIGVIVIVADVVNPIRLFG
ncbi:M50 family metallopeptidase [Corynebacterium cystitidis]|uniref:Zinc metalloprotease Rip1 n=1 Tax=Corynebacterium cystitidis DSM 20524 TaxID=1121357 RepID=A0A1H9NYR1_9CORY|nr:M50 family metallopeptidase [Corynebacterium cystitidis]WJY82677.1 Zinc metalloprotease Rip1 [Corynebacterium cystitidis DSM 20524]SER41068.1 RIP metalloprotease RseP [Corynebacterium cystitidis DSM 20524]SNV71935.1 membrane-associated zinc metalloprotease [Corynebacterium cystitidis]